MRANNELNEGITKMFTFLSGFCVARQLTPIVSATRLNQMNKSIRIHEYWSVDIVNVIHVVDRTANGHFLPFHENRIYDDQCPVDYLTFYEF